MLENIKESIFCNLFDAVKMSEISLIIIIIITDSNQNIHNEDMDKYGHHEKKQSPEAFCKKGLRPTSLLKKRL